MEVDPEEFIKIVKWWEKRYEHKSTSISN
jgi:hypothetical protein